MSATQDGGLDLRETLVRIDRAQAEIGKLLAEQRKLVSEQLKLDAEAKKFDRDRWLAPLTAFIALLAAAASVVSVYISHLPH